jgi:photosystem II stability/assembly factor-like uncharacterized protein
LDYWNIVNLAIDPSNTSILYVAANGGGMFKSTDGAASWTQINSGLTNFTLTTIAIDPVTPSTLYVGTYGDGVFKSTDGGLNWNPAGPIGKKIRSQLISQ